MLCWHLYTYIDIAIDDVCILLFCFWFVLFKLNLNHMGIGHAMGDDGPKSKAVGELFNGISIGFKPPQVVEGLLSFEDAMDDYTKWADSVVRLPHVTMVESAVRLMFGYGYGFNTQLSKAGEEGYIPRETLTYASQEYQYVR